MIRLFAGYDPRESDGWHVFVQSVMDKTTVPVSITPLHLPMLSRYYDDSKSTGTNAFNLSRFLVPWLCDYKGVAIFADGADMLVRHDLNDLMQLFDASKAVQVVKHDYKTKNPRKYIGTSMEADNEDYPRKNWSSLMIINCEHPAWSVVTPSAITNGTITAKSLHRFEFLMDDEIGQLASDWNWLVGEYFHSPYAKIAHFTLGIPSFDHYRNCDHSQEWLEVRGMV